MKKYTCPIHNLEIIIYKIDEENQFIDDNRKEVAICYDANGMKYLRRFIIGECDENCSTIQELLK